MSSENVCGHSRKPILFCEVFFSQYHSKISANIDAEIVPQVCIKKCKTRFVIYKANLNFLRSSRHFNCDTAFLVIAFFFKKSGHGFDNCRNGGVETGFQIV